MSTTLRDVSHSFTRTYLNHLFRRWRLEMDKVNYDKSQSIIAQREFKIKVERKNLIEFDEKLRNKIRNEPEPAHPDDELFKKA